jgi:hypothetical protein
MDLIERYCRDDVAITRDLCDSVLKAFSFTAGKVGVFRRSLLIGDKESRSRGCEQTHKFRSR